MTLEPPPKVLDHPTLNRPHLLADYLHVLPVDLCNLVEAFTGPLCGLHDSPTNLNECERCGGPVCRNHEAQCSTYTCDYGEDLCRSCAADTMTGSCTKCGIDSMCMYCEEEHEVEQDPLAPPTPPAGVMSEDDTERDDEEAQPKQNKRPKRAWQDPCMVFDGKRRKKGEGCIVHERRGVSDRRDRRKIKELMMSLGVFFGRMRYGSPPCDQREWNALFVVADNVRYVFEESKQQTPDWFLAKYQHLF